MTLLSLVTRWLAHRGADVQPTRAGAHVELRPDDPLSEVLGERFVLMPAAVDAIVPPGAEPVYAGSRIAGLLAGDVEPTRGIAVMRAPPIWNLAEPLCIVSFQAVFTTDGRVEQMIRVALTEDGRLVPLPPEADPPLAGAEDGARWRSRVERLLPVARDIARETVERRATSVEHEAQRRLYRTVRRLAAYYGPRMPTREDHDTRSEYRRRLIEETDRHRLRLTLDLIGVTVALP